MLVWNMFQGYVHVGVLKSHTCFSLQTVSKTKPRSDGSDGSEQLSCADLLLAELGDLLLHHGDLSVHSVHVLDQLLL